MNIKENIRRLESCIDNPENGVGEDLFLFFSRNTPLVNVDLLIKDKANNILLTWRDDRYHEAGWHIPGGVIRYKESYSRRIKAVAREELGCSVDFEPAPVCVKEIILPDREDRGHFISLLYKCTLSSSLDSKMQAAADVKAGQWAWHKKCPDNIISVHKMYKFLWSQ